MKSSETTLKYASTPVCQMNRYYGIAFTEWDTHRSTLLWIACEKWMMRPLLLGHPILGIYWESATERIITANVYDKYGVLVSQTIISQNIKELPMT